MTWLKQPLFHFFVIGIFIFILYELSPASQSRSGVDTLHVDEESLIRFIKIRTKIFEDEIAQRRLYAMNTMELDFLVEEYIREEILYREAQAMGLEADDYVIKRRLVQKMEYILESSIPEIDVPSDEELMRYFQANLDSYFVEPTVTFSQIFFDLRVAGSEGVRLTSEIRDRLNANGVSLHDAPKYGDPFIYNVNYVESNYDLISSHFGSMLADEMFSNKIRPSSRWLGPYKSDHGLHLIYLADRTAGGYPELDDVQEDLLGDFLIAERRKLLDLATKNKIDNYLIVKSYLPPTTARSDLK